MWTGESLSERSRAYIKLPVGLANCIVHFAPGNLSVYEHWSDLECRLQPSQPAFFPCDSG